MRYVWIMWKQFVKYFNKYPKRKKLARKLLEYGLKIRDDRIYCGEIELSDSKIARAFDMDRRIIVETIQTINENEELRKIFSKLMPTCNLKDVAPEMDWGVIEIIPSNASKPGILANVSKIIADAKISIRQSIVDDFEFTEEPRLFIVTETQVPGTLIQKFRAIDGVKGVVVY